MASVSGSTAAPLTPTATTPCSHICIAGALPSFWHAVRTAAAGAPLQLTKESFTTSRVPAPLALPMPSGEPVDVVLELDATAFVYGSEATTQWGLECELNADLVPRAAEVSGAARSPCAQPEIQP